MKAVVWLPVFSEECSCVVCLVRSFNNRSGLLCVFRMMILNRKDG